MELLRSLIGTSYVFPGLAVSVVFLGAVLLFVFGFKSAEEPSFTNLKSANKKKKSKDKVSFFSCIIRSDHLSKLITAYDDHYHCNVFQHNVLILSQKTSNGAPNSPEAKSKTNANSKSKPKSNNAEEKPKKNALKDSKQMNVTKNVKKDTTPKEKPKKTKGKENIDVGPDVDFDGG